MPVKTQPLLSLCPANSAIKPPKRSVRTHSRQGFFRIAALLTTLAIPQLSAAQCYGTYINLTASTAGMTSTLTMPIGPLYNVLTQQCSGVIMASNYAKFGTVNQQPQFCQGMADQVGTMGAYVATLQAIWVDPTARLAAGNDGGCTFTCGTYTCRVQGADGLPVELLELSVD